MNCDKICKENEEMNIFFDWWVIILNGSFKKNEGKWI